ncbi:cupin domain-containing protein [Thalassospira sp.]|uniref:cupin domain-containing protein n=1 Tax=Thalassospira sp. TaxID=1912094 RepID=UPI0027350BD8|nr:cupin domain-containing protein [Thalassospira sp.]MDP2697718.1 cupin domain-containing protein [Thalassospira sp.]
MATVIEDGKPHRVASNKIGDRLKSVRNMYGLSQRELARRAGVTNSTISTIEQNRVSPSVDSLTKVLDGIPMSLIDFFTIDLDNGEEIFFRRDDLVELSDGTMSMRLVGATRKDRKLRVLHEIYPPKGGTGDRLIIQKGEEAGVVVRGRLEVTVGDRVQVLEPGDAYYFNAEIPHRFRNPDDAECEVVSAATPPSY